jgi:hypothetical protein
LNKKLFWVRLGTLLPGIMLIMYLSIIVIARSSFPLGIFLLLLSLGGVALILILKALVESRADVEKTLHDKNP